jgi:hypothetical protein
MPVMIHRQAFERDPIISTAHGNGIQLDGREQNADAGDSASIRINEDDVLPKIERPTIHLVRYGQGVQQFQLHVRSQCAGLLRQPLS